MKNSNFNYLVIEDDTNVWSNIERRMSQFENWHSAGFCSEIEDSLQIISEKKPHLIFSDWSIKGGNAFQILDFIKTIPSYQPYIIFFTGYQSEHPEIPQEIFNKYPIVKKYIIKPIYENLTNHLADYVKEAEILHDNNINTPLFLENEFKQRIRVYPEDCIAFIQCDYNPRIKTIYINNQPPMNVKYTWEEILEFAKKSKIDFYITHNRKSVINRKYILKMHRPFIWLTEELKVEVAREKWKDFNENI